MSWKSSLADRGHANVVDNTKSATSPTNNLNTIKSSWTLDNTNRNLYLAKSLFFCTAMSTVGWTRFQNNFYLDQGMSSSQIGILKGFGLLCKFLGEPILCFLADMYNAKVVFLISIFMQVMTMEVMRIVTPLTFQVLILVKFMRASTAPSSTLTTMASLKLTEGTNQGLGHQRMFGSLAWGCGAFIAGFLIDTYGMISLFYYTYFFNLVSFLFVFYGLPSNFASNASTNSFSEKKISSQADFASMSAPVQSESTSLSSQQSVSSPSSDQLLRRAASSSPNLDNVINDKEGGFTNASPPPSGKYESNGAHKTIKQHFSKQLQSLWRFLSDPCCRVVLINAFFHGIVMTVPETYFFISLETNFHTSRTYSGLCTTTSILACLPLFWYSDHFIQKYGHTKLVIGSQLTTVLRMLAYAIVPMRSDAISFAMILCIQLLHGFNFALYWSATVDLIYKISPNDLRISCMSTLNIVYFTIAAGVGNVAWGYIYDFGGVRFVYIAAAVLCWANLTYFSKSENLVKISHGPTHMYNQLSQEP